MNSELLDGGAVALGFSNRYECALALLGAGFGSNAVSDVTALSPEAIRALFDAARGEGEMVGVMEERSNTSAIALQAQMQVQSRCCAR
jgi:hypothetical protein